ncbi:MAG: hypothetical protein AB8B91_13275 [Rubripirellula sp.]
MDDSTEHVSVDSCCYRGSGAELAVCALVCQLAGTPNEFSFVPRAACDACVGSFRPTNVDPNPIVASLAFSAAESYLATLSPDSESFQNTAAKRDIAESFLPRVLPDESDTEPIRAATHSIDLEELKRRLPVPPTSCQRRQVRNWAVGVTTAPRRQSTLDATLDGMRHCGWENPQLFVDGEVELSDEAKLCLRTSRSQPVGAWHNFFLGLTELVERNPAADAYLMAQDDVLWPLAFRLPEYLSEMLWPTNSDCIVSLYTSADDAHEDAGWRAFPETWKFGALAFVFPRHVARRMTGDPRLRRYGWSAGVGVAGVDVAIGTWARQRDVEVWHPTPSVVQHGGHVSSIWRTSRAVGLRRAATWVGDDPT